MKQTRNPYKLICCRQERFWQGLPDQGVLPDPSCGPNAAAAFAAGRAHFPPPDLPAGGGYLSESEGDEEIGPPRLRMEPGYDPAGDFASTTTAASPGPYSDSDDSGGSERSEDTGDGPCWEAAAAAGGGPAGLEESLAPDEQGAAPQDSEWAGPGLSAASGAESESVDGDGAGAAAWRGPGVGAPGPAR